MDPNETLDAFFDRQLARATRGLEDGSSTRFFTFTRDTGLFIGTFNLNNITRGVAQYADAGWLLDARYLGRGFATEGVNALLDLAFTPEPAGLGLHRVQAAIIPRNAPSLRVAERCGLQREGIARKYIRINGVWEDHVIHAKLVDEHVVSDANLSH
jgi:ribosomal-protein-alanine N-acetyltransferase